MNGKAKILTITAGAMGLTGLVNELSADQWKHFTIAQSDLENYDSTIPLYLTKLKAGDEIFYNLNSKRVVLKSQGTERDITSLPGTEGQQEASQIFDAFLSSTNLVKTETIDDGKGNKKQKKNDDSGASTEKKFATRVILSANGSYLLQNAQDRVIGPVRQKVDEDGMKANGRLDVQSAPFMGPFGIDGSLLFNFLWTTYHNNSTISGANAPGFGDEVGGRNSQMLEGKMSLFTFNLGNKKYFFHMAPLGYLAHYSRNSQEFLSTGKRIGKDDYQGLFANFELVGKHFDDGRLVGLEYQLIFGEKGTPEGTGKTAIGDGHRIIFYAGTPKIAALHTMFNAYYDLTLRNVNYGTGSGSAKELETRQIIGLNGETQIGKSQVSIIFGYSMTDFDPAKFDANIGVKFNFTGNNPDFYKSSGSKRK